jgi:hypothetical protein
MGCCLVLCGVGWGCCLGVCPVLPLAPNAGGELLGKSASFFPVSSSALLGRVERGAGRLSAVLLPGYRPWTVGTDHGPEHRPWAGALTMGLSTDHGPGHRPWAGTRTMHRARTMGRGTDHAPGH